MTNEIRGRENHFEDRYIKYECQSCKRCFILGERLSGDMEISCPYCRSQQIETAAIATEDCTENMDMGCLGLYYSTYGDGSLMLHTESELREALADAAVNGALRETVMDSLVRYCAKRDGR